MHSTTDHLLNCDPISIGLIEPNSLGRSLMREALQRVPDFNLRFACDEVVHAPAQQQLLDVLLLCTPAPCNVFGEGLLLDYWEMRFPGAAIVLLTDFCVRETLICLLDSGLRGLALRQSTDIEELLQLVRAANSGEVALCRAARGILNTRPEISDALTEREFQLVRLAHEVGVQNRKVIAQRLGISRNTVSVHLLHISDKLGVGAPNIVARCRELGLIELSRASLPSEVILGKGCPFFVGFGGCGIGKADT
ncbi:MAG: response regulator transcription factor [Anaerolineae bacterium]|nr:response regulator transcription factor [Anaerolineae bacterium]